MPSRIRPPLVDILRFGFTPRVSWGGVRGRPGPNLTYNRAREPAHFRARLLGHSGFRSVFYWSARGPTTAHAPVHPFVHNPNQFLDCKFWHSETEPKASVVLDQSRPDRSPHEPGPDRSARTQSNPTPYPLRIHSGPTPNPLRTHSGPVQNRILWHHSGFVQIQSESRPDTARSPTHVKCMLTLACNLRESGCTVYCD
jgi:hypothetical protein